MIQDIQEFQNNSELQTDLAIIGAGPAGITIAREFAGGPFDVCLLEAGSLKPDPKSQALYSGDNTGIDYPLETSRLRYFGGSSNHWGGFCFPLEPIDFEARDWVPYSGWPISFDTLSPYYDRASDIVEVAPGRFQDIDYWNSQYREKLPKLLTGRLKPGIVQYSPPTRFGERYREELEQARNIRVLLNANVVNISANNNGGSINHIRIKTLTGQSYRLKARFYVLATGGLENARMLLLANDVVRSGLGNENDLVGRFFMEHPHMNGNAEIVAADSKRIPRLFRELVTMDRHKASVGFRPSTDYLRSHQLLNASIQIGIAEEIRAGKLPQYLPAERARAHTDMLQAARHFLIDAETRTQHQDRDYLGVWLGSGCACEQAPNPDSRVTLASERDALGLPKIRLDWRLTEQDRRSIVQHFYSLALEFGALGLGRLFLNMVDDGLWPEKVRGGNHHMGTTRMSDSPKQGVVDRHCKIHSIDNLYVSGSSVFTTSGIANPTLTIVALSLRLAEHLKERLS